MLNQTKQLPSFNWEHSHWINKLYKTWKW